ncbi:PSD1 and planctomycete cytochrome C domain-containing protein [Urbifossiella limnaea]|uniref:Planctomycete cytochrome C n=1 Tax=Urbifossiella limnaea TaxID=2528023 RepID=A0A517XXC5_9BACT|nr:PSD1 and planctomycete cytochrome C domain-containing protein [Urbifossiella limnaea]QDU22167.1 Planctomycete cytochrome C [Urbifossiella limnaea]
MSLRAALVASVVLLSPVIAAAQPAAEHFEKHVRPLLLEHCGGCHGKDGKAKGGLKLTTAAELAAGGESGPVVVPGHADKSLLVETVRYGGDLKMPPKGKLRPDQIAALEKWVKDGAVWPGGTGVTAASGGRWDGGITDDQKRFWAFQPVREPKVPDTNHPTQSRIDAFVRTRLDAAGLTPAPPADRRTLIRRVTYDLTGLPPTPEEVAAFLADRGDGAFARVVDRLLASSAYGERWARHWLDVARYADSNGLDENTAFGNAWRYRDYVVRAFNTDKPYDRFVLEQLAGDLLPDDAATREDRLTATGFLVLGPKLLAEPDKAKMVMDIVDEQIDVAGKAFLGLTVSCARCHDHKFDPIPTRDYYALAGIFKSTKTMATLATVAKAHERPLGPKDSPETLLYRDRLKLVTKELRTLEQEFGKLPATDKDKRHALHLKAEERRAEIKQLEKTVPPPAVVLAVQDEANPADVKVHVRGNTQTLGELAPRGFLRVVSDKAPSIPAKASGRLELARWVASADNPLTARVLVNRVWQHHFGEGLVRTPDDFGTRGERPSHPELLDWLAAQFVKNGWSLKSLHRLILLSDTYQMASRPVPAAAAAVDPDNRLLSHFPRRRLEAEAVRDAMLAVAGTLDRTAGGTLLENGNFEYINNDRARGVARYDNARRSLYLPVIRNNVFDFFQTFDFVEPHVSNGKRAVTVVAPQALYLMNNPFVARQAAALAESLLKLPADDAGRVAAAYERAYGRPPTTEETARALAFVGRYAAALEGAERRPRAWAAWCHVVFASSEFVYVE